jgi:hypothetical protein
MAATLQSSITAFGILLFVFAGADHALAQGRTFRSADDARQWLTSKGITVTPGNLLAFLGGDDPESVNVMRAYAALGFPLNGPGGDELSPLTLVARSCVGNEVAPLTTAVLIAAGANPTLPAPDGDKTTPLMEAVNCPLVLEAMLARKVELSTIDQRGFTVMHHAVGSEERLQSTRIVRDAGFDVPRWRAALTKEFGHLPNLTLLLDGPAGAPAAATATGSIDWAAVGPYPARNKAEAAKLLSRPGADTTADDHFWDGINRLQPQRLALALQAGANVRAVYGSGSTPLITLAEHCDDKRVDVLQSIADQLIAAKADTAGVDLVKQNALMAGAGKCPIGVLRAFIAAGVPVNGVDAAGNTAMKSAIMNGRADVVSLLIDAGVDPRKEPYNAGRLASGNQAVQDALRRKPKQ